MSMKVGMTPLQWSQSPIPHHPPPSTSLQTLASAVTSPASSSSKKRSGSADGIVCRYFVRSDRSQSSLFSGTSSSSQPASTKLLRHRSCDELHKLSHAGGRRSSSTIRRSHSASLEGAFSDEEFSKHIEELAIKFHMPNDGSRNPIKSASVSGHRVAGGEGGGGDFESHHRRLNHQSRNSSSSSSSMMESMEQEINREPPDWTGREDIEIERKANSVDVPHSLRIIKKKIIQQMQWQGESDGIVESACYCSIKKAFSSMVFIIKELHSYTLQLREFLYYEDLRGILADVQKEMQASFVWLFQRVFSHTPSFMISLMILLANFSVHSMSVNSILPDLKNMDQVQIVGSVSLSWTQDYHEDVDSSAIRTATFGGEDGGGREKPVVSGGEGWADRSSGDFGRSVVHDSDGKRREVEESISGYDHDVDEEARVWNAFQEEASRMEAELRDESLMDRETIRRFVSPVKLDVDSLESDVGYEEIIRTELLYRTGLAQEPNNPLLLVNYAQFLYLVARDYDRAEEYFKKATEIEPKDAEACNKYATFLWLAKNDLWGAEETYQQAIEAEPSSMYYASSYANFLWSTGGEDTCFPLDEDEDEDKGEDEEVEEEHRTRGPEDREEYGFGFAC